MSKEERADYQNRLSILQRECRELGIPVMIVFEGMAAAGKGRLIQSLIEPMDPRGFLVHTSRNWTKDEKKYFYMRKFWLMTPPDGQFAVFDQSWYSKILLRWDKKQIVETYAQDMNMFERELTDGGTIILKVFLTLSRKEQTRRLNVLASSKDTSWHVRKIDRDQNEHYKKFMSVVKRMLKATDKPYAPWRVIENDKGCDAEEELLEFVVSKLEERVNERKQQKPAEDIEQENNAAIPDILGSVDPNQEISKEEYYFKYHELSSKLAEYHNVLYRHHIPVIIAFEGWDAGGKGGAIKRLTSHLDPRGYAVHPVSAPTPYEKSHNYLYRFWQNVPKCGHITIFDRSWYGRVMVERIEGFCTEDDWKRAYGEINETEAFWAREGAIVLKFWMQIDKDEQEKRFRARMEDPEKQWKITDEDWRNRDKWDQYVTAVNEMISRTSSEKAPWIIIEGNNKYFARIKVMQTVADAIEERLSKE